MTNNIIVGRADHGKRMSLRDFEFAQTKEGCRYELSRGVVSVSEIPDFAHLSQLDELRKQLHRYDATHPDSLYGIAGASDCKLLIREYESERHPDVAIYMDPPTCRENDNPWPHWIPAVVVEIVSSSTRTSDYGEKREDYLRLGVSEYWIIDSEKEQMLALQNSGGQWVEQIVGANRIHTTKLLPDLEVAMKPIFDAAREAR